MPRLRAMSQGRQQDLTNKALADRKRIHKQGKQTRYNKVRSVFGFVFFSSPGSNKCIMISVYSGPLLFSENGLIARAETAIGGAGEGCKKGLGWETTKPNKVFVGNTDGRNRRKVSSADV